MTVEDIWAMRDGGEPVLSPDGSQVQNYRHRSGEVLAWLGKYLGPA